MASPRFDEPFLDDDDGDGRARSVDIAEAMVSTLAVERGGLMRIDHDRVKVAAKMAAKRYPSGIHAHFTADDRALQVELVDRDKCEWRKETVVESTTFDATDGKMEVRNPGQMSRAELESINQVQHILLMTALRKMGEVAIEVSHEEFQDMIASSGMGMAALSISRKGDRVYASLLTESVVGQA